MLLTVTVITYVCRLSSAQLAPSRCAGESLTSVRRVGVSSTRIARRCLDGRDERIGSAGAGGKRDVAGFSLSGGTACARWLGRIGRGKYTCLGLCLLGLRKLCQIKKSTNYLYDLRPPGFMGPWRSHRLPLP
jgi:hypothetical protein